jgi:hypothetical protein
MAKATSMKTIPRGEYTRMVRQILDEVGTACTVRQVYYRGLDHGWWGKDGPHDKFKRYKRVGRWLTQMRAEGLVGYDEILEYGRRPSYPSRSWDSAEGYRDTIKSMFRFDAWKYQPVYVEMWTEGEAIAPIAEQAIDGLRVPLVVNKGNTSTSAIHKSAHRLALALRQQLEVHHGDEFDPDDDAFDMDPKDFPSGLVHILYAGDHDAAGVHMDKDLQTRMVTHAGESWLKEWIASCLEWGVIEFERVAVTPDQVEEYDLPGVEQKWTDQSKNYFEEFGHMNAWAFEALPPDEAPRILREAVEGLMDKATWERSLKLEKAVRANLSEYGSITR